MKPPSIVTTSIDRLVYQYDISIQKINFHKPWGGYYVINEESLPKFIELFFPELSNTLSDDQQLSPKILFVAPNKKLSWQYHHRRSELWKVMQGEVAVARSQDDQENTPELLNEGDQIELQEQERHRLIGLSDWGIVCEIWQHSNSSHLSDELDIVRVQDDFGR